MPPPRKGSEPGAPARARPGSKPISPTKGRASLSETRKTLTPAPTAQAPPGDDYAVPVREVVKPPGQLVLDEKELGEEVGRVLTAANPSAPANLVRYSQRERGYRPEPLIDQLLHHFSLDGCLMHQDSEEAVKERQRREAAAFAAVSRRVTAQSRRMTAQSRRVTAVQPDFASSGVQASMPRASIAGEAAAGLPPGPEASLARLLPGEEESEAKQLRNQFNFTDRAASTGNGAPRARGTMTEAPPTTSTAGSCTRWEIFDAFIEDQERQRVQEEMAKLKVQAARKGGATATAAGAGLLGRMGVDAGAAGGSDATGPGSAARAVRVVDRMVQQNLFKDVVMDFKYWDDPADAVRQQEGTLLPLWAFTSPRVKGRAVTAIAWSPRYFDLFAVGYGSYDFQAPTTGLVCCYSLKSPSQPEQTFALPAGVLCLDFHPEHPNLLAVGCYDGCVCVYDVRPASGLPGGSSSSGGGGSFGKEQQGKEQQGKEQQGKEQQQQQGAQPLYASTARSGKHSEPVWQVCWQRTDSHELKFCSVSSDGRVTLWSVSKNELSFRDMLVLRQLDSDTSSSGSSSNRAGAANGSNPGSRGPALPTAAGAGASEEEGGEELGPAALAGGLCFDFNHEQEHLFVVGTEEGTIYKCSTALTSQYLAAFSGHRLPIYALRWNGLHPRAFLSGGADWTVKLWDTLQPRPVMSFDLGSPVGDVAWAPFSSTTFAAVTEAGRVHVFDLAQNRAVPCCVQRAAKKARLTRLAFNAWHPVLLVGDDKGGLTCFKLSPNLRKGLGPPGASSSSAGSSSSSTAASSSIANGSAAAEGGSTADGGKSLARSTSQRQAASSSSSRSKAEAARLEAVLAVAQKCNRSMTEEDWELL